MLHLQASGSVTRKMVFISTSTIWKERNCRLMRVGRCMPLIRADTDHDTAFYGKSFILRHLFATVWNNLLISYEFLNSIGCFIMFFSFLNFVTASILQCLICVCHIDKKTTYLLTYLKLIGWPLSKNKLIKSFKGQLLNRYLMEIVFIQI